MTEQIKVKHSETHWSCGDGCCDHYDVVSSFMYKDSIYEYDSGSADVNIRKFLEEVIGVEFDEEYEFKDLDQDRIDVDDFDE